MKNTYLFYDLETSGLNPCFDQVMQFAAIRTDLAMNEISRHEIFVTLNPDVIPAPDALAIHQVGLSDIANGDNEWDAIRKIHALLNQPDTISVGYNTLGFDDEFLRFSFFRNLLPCYTHQYANQCSRMDLYPITALYYLFATDSLSWPEVDEHVSLKLENLNKANQLADGQAHNAMVDVEATVALAKHLAAKKDMWQYACGYFNKATDLSRLNQLPVAFEADRPYHLALAVMGNIGYRHRFIAPVLHLGQHQHYKNQSLWLRLDTVEFSDTKPDELISSCFVMKKRAAEPPLILPPKPRFMTAVDETRQQLCERNQQFLHDNPELLMQLCKHHQHFTFENVEQADTQSQLYQMDFPSKQDSKHCAALHKLPPKKWSQTLAQLEQPIYQQLAVRVLGRHFSDAQTVEQAAAFNEYMKTCYDNNHARIDFRKKPALTVEQALIRCEQLLEDSLSERQRKILSEYQSHLLRYTQQPAITE